MKSLSVGFTESQLDHLRTIKLERGISMAGFLRVLLKADMERALLPEYAVVTEQREVSTMTKRRVVIHRGPVSPERSALMKELNLALEKRKQKMETAVVVSPLRA